MEGDRVAASFCTYNIRGQFSRISVCESNDIVSYCTASVHHWRIQLQLKAHIRQEKPLCAATRASRRSREHLGRGTWLQWPRQQVQMWDGEKRESERQIIVSEMGSSFSSWARVLGKAWPLPTTSLTPTSHPPPPTRAARAHHRRHPGSPAPTRGPSRLS